MLLKLPVVLFCPTRREELHILNRISRMSSTSTKKLVYMLVLFVTKRFPLFSNSLLKCSIHESHNMDDSKTKIRKVFEIYCIETYNIILFDICLSYFCFYFITLFPDSVLCLLQKPTLDLCCVVGLLPPRLILIMTT